MRNLPRLRLSSYGYKRAKLLKKEIDAGNIPTVYVNPCNNFDFTVDDLLFLGYVYEEWGCDEEVCPSRTFFYKGRGAIFDHVNQRIAKRGDIIGMQPS